MLLSCLALAVAIDVPTVNWRSRMVHMATCDPLEWLAVKKVCSELAPCAALIDFEALDAVNCRQFCAGHQLACAGANDERRNSCLVNGRLAAFDCETPITRALGHDAICQCLDPSVPPSPDPTGSVPTPMPTPMPTTPLVPATAPPASPPSLMPSQLPTPAPTPVPSPSPSLASVAPTAPAPVPTSHPSMLPSPAHTPSPSPAPAPEEGECDTETWTAVKNGEVCSELANCAALIDFKATDAATCGEFCAGHQLACAGANDERHNRCLINANAALAMDCDTPITRSVGHDAICYCEAVALPLTPNPTGSVATPMPTPTHPPSRQLPTPVPTPVPSPSPSLASVAPTAPAPVPTSHPSMLPSPAHTPSPSPAPAPEEGECDTETWTAVKNGEVCSELANCAALIDFKATDAATCGEFCAGHQLACAGANDERHNRCLINANAALAMECDTPITRSVGHDAICYCEAVALPPTPAVPTAGPSAQLTPMPMPSPSPTRPQPTNSGSAHLTLSGELKRWHKVTVDLTGPSASETGSPNAFLDFRFEVTFRHAETGASVIVPGFFAADGDAAETDATTGNIWRAHFCPPLTGVWVAVVGFTTGDDAAIFGGGQQHQTYDGEFTSMLVAETDKQGRDHRSKGMLRYTGERYLQFDNGEHFVKAGADSPENLLGYEDFSGTSSSGRRQLHAYQPHVNDWTDGDPTWKGGKGKGLIGGLNYLASKGMNVISFLTFNVAGDAKDTWPFVSSNDWLHYDVSKLAQWEIVFEHADKLGIFLHFKTQETENDGAMDNGNTGQERRLYYRELVARFSHHHALNWNLGEENTQSTQQHHAMGSYFHEIDPYNHPVVIHTYPHHHNRVYGPLLGSDDLDGASIQVSHLRHYFDHFPRFSRGVPPNVRRVLHKPALYLVHADRIQLVLVIRCCARFTD